MTEETKQEPIDYAKLLTEHREAQAKAVLDYQERAQKGITEQLKRVAEAESELFDCDRDDATGIAKHAAVLAARSSELSALMIATATRMAAMELATVRSAGPLGMFGL